MSCWERFSVRVRAVRDQLHPASKRFDAGNPLDGMRVEERLAQAAEEHGWQRRQALKVLHDFIKGSLRHPAQGLVPGIANADTARQVTAVGRLDIDFRQVSHRTVQAQAVDSVFQAHARPWLQTEAGNRLRRQDQPAFSIYFGPENIRHGSTSVSIFRSFLPVLVQCGQGQSCTGEWTRGAVGEAPARLPARPIKSRTRASLRR